MKLLLIHNAAINNLNLIIVVFNICFLLCYENR